MVVYTLFCIVFLLKMTIKEAAYRDTEFRKA